VDDRLAIFLCALGGAGFLGLVGGLFGGLAGALARMHGTAPGSLLGSHVLRAIERVGGESLSPVKAGALVGTVDGASFLGVIGGLLGLLAGYGEWISPKDLIGILLGIAVLAIVAVHFGVLAYCMLRAGMRAFTAMCAGGLIGGVTGAWLGGQVGLIVGIEIGAVGGLIVGTLTRRASRNDRPFDAADGEKRRHFLRDTNIQADHNDSIRPAWDQFRSKEREP
jgi:hypothetical protein